MLQKTPEAHPEHEGLAKTLERVQLIANNVNEFSRKKHTDEVFFDLSQRLTGMSESLAAPGRFVVLERESIEVIGLMTKFKRDSLFLVILTDCLIFAKSKKKKLEFRTKLSFDHLSWRLPETIMDDEWPLVLSDTSSGKLQETTLIDTSKRGRDALCRALESCKKTEGGELIIKKASADKPALKRSSSSEGLQTPRSMKQRMEVTAAPRSVSATTPLPAPPALAPPPLVAMGDPSAASQRRHTISLLDLGPNAPKLLSSLGSVLEEAEGATTPKHPTQFVATTALPPGRPQVNLIDGTATVSASSSVKRNRRRSLPTNMSLAPEMIPSAETLSILHAESQSSTADRAKFKSVLDAKLQEVPPAHQPPKRKASSKTLRGSRSEQAKMMNDFAAPLSMPSLLAKLPAPLITPGQMVAVDEVGKLKRENQQLKDRVNQLEATLNLMAAALRGIEASAAGTKSLWNH